jgi:hypothetical protein
MSERNDKNMSAFPLPLGNENIDPSVAGITIRDYFAAKAMQGWIANPTVNYGLPSDASPQILADVAAVWAYMAADAMMKERLK